MKSKKAILDAKRLSGQDDVQVILNDMKKVSDELSDSSEELEQYMSTFAEFSDILVITLKKLTPQIMNATTEECKWKIIWFLRFHPMPSSAAICSPNKKGKALKIVKELCYECMRKAWLEVSGLQLSNSMLLFVVPHFVEKLMDLLPSTELFSDFLYRTFNSGGYLAVLSLAGIFKLIVKNNFEHPNFYSDVYSTISSNICYSNYAQKFFSLIDLILSSSHVPVYIIVAFLKKLSRVLLYSPLHCQLPLLTSIKNILKRHEVAHSILLNRENPSVSVALTILLWEIKAIQQHWHKKVADKAQFIDQKMQDHEVGVVWQTSEQIFDSVFNKSLAKLNSMESTLPDNSSVSQDDDDDQEEQDEYEPEEKRVRFGNHKKIVGLNLINEKEPSNSFLSFENTNKLWCS
uniref:CCAAT-binding factor domain-containing protein n=1 Tax=Ditylenchus dipsaci TaxID=166011 RepID=A0A915DFB1_9BILA